MTDVREAMLDAAESQLAASDDGDIATRAVCEAVGVGQPVLYRLFGDKRGLLDALADRGLERYAARKAELEETDDPVADMRAGWNDHVAFSHDHPALYQLMFAPRPWSRSIARSRIFELMLRTLGRVSAAGLLAVAPRDAAELLLSGHIGIALNRIADPERFGDPELPESMREALFARVLVPGALAGGSTAGTPAPLEPAARQLRSQLELGAESPLEAAERGLLLLWLQRLGG